jgi:hypothetical protein
MTVIIVLDNDRRFWIAEEGTNWSDFYVDCDMGIIDISTDNITEFSKQEIVKAVNKILGEDEE